MPTPRPTTPGSLSVISYPFSASTPRSFNRRLRSTARAGTSLVATGSTDIIGASLGGAVSGGVSVLTHPAANTFAAQPVGSPDHSQRTDRFRQRHDQPGIDGQCRSYFPDEFFAERSRCAQRRHRDFPIASPRSVPGPSRPLPIFALSGNASPNPVAPRRHAHLRGDRHQSRSQSGDGGQLDGFATRRRDVSCPQRRARAPANAGKPRSPVTLGTLINGESVPVTIVATVTVSQGTLVNTATGCQQRHRSRRRQQHGDDDHPDPSRQAQCRSFDQPAGIRLIRRFPVARSPTP